MCVCVCVRVNVETPWPISFHHAITILHFRYTIVDCDQFHCFREQNILKYNKSMFLKYIRTQYRTSVGTLHNIALKEVKKGYSKFYLP